MKRPIELVMATRNTGKLRELRQALRDLPLALADLTNFPSVREIVETADSFSGNAELKATGYATQTHLLTLADDSGLEIDALGGAPGVHSARYLGESVSFAVRIGSLLARLSSVEPARRTARFVCAIAIAEDQGTMLSISMGTCEGSIASEPRGSGGFGYDPIFIPRGSDLTFGELDSQIKNQISHRARALQGAREYLERLTSTLNAG